MAKGVKYKVKFKRRIHGKTNFRKRLALLKSKKLRLVARIHNRSVVVQIIEYNPDGDKTIINSTSNELKSYGWKGHKANLGASYLTGFLCGTKAKDKGIKEAILDIGLHTPVPGSNVFGVLNGAIDAGLDLPHSEKSLPLKDRISSKDNVSEVKEKIASGLIKNTAIKPKAKVK